ncbi:MAG: hypothetical protein LW806_02620 [Planctomycetaceae bacterium]|nr:hypothetical protein [Planctomycetaceae bacterium]
MSSLPRHLDLNITTILIASVTALVPGIAADAAQVAFIDAQGRSWRQVTETIGSSWQAIAQRCPVDGVSPCTGTLGGQDLAGWVWATDEQVAGLFEEFMPGISEAGSLSGGNCVLPGLGFLSTFDPTYAGYTTFGASFYISGWSATTTRGNAAIAPEVAAGYQPHHGSFNLLAQASVTSASAYRGAWLFKPPMCPSDLDANGDVGAGDLATLLGSWGTNGTGTGGRSADLDGDGTVGAGDLSALLGAWGACGG